MNVSEYLKKFLVINDQRIKLTFHDKIYARKFRRNNSLCAIDNRESEQELEARERRECAHT